MTWTRVADMSPRLLMMSVYDVDDTWTLVVDMTRELCVEDICDGHVLWACVVDICGGHVLWTCVRDTCGRVSWTRGHVSWTRVADMCCAHVLWTRVHVHSSWTRLMDMSRSCFAQVTASAVAGMMNLGKAPCGALLPFTPSDEAAAGKTLSSAETCRHDCAQQRRRHESSPSRGGPPSH